MLFPQQLISKFISTINVIINLVRGRTGSSDRPWLIRQTGLMISDVTRKSGATANNSSEYSPPS